MTDDTHQHNRPPYLVVHHHDPELGVHGVLVIDRLIDGLAAGGLRVRPGVDERELAELARVMSLKQAVAGIPVGGAKAGLDMDPAAPYRERALARFIAALRPLLLECFSCGPDVNTTLAELERIARGVGVPALKVAVGRRREIGEARFLERYALFEQSVDGATVNEQRAAAAVVAATEELGAQLLDRARARPSSGATLRVAIQGAGAMGGGAARMLHRRGVRVVAWSDAEKCLRAPEGLDVDELVRGRSRALLPRGAREELPSRALLTTPCDVLVLAATSRAVRLEEHASVRARGLVCAANVALEEDVERAFHQRGVLVVPDVIASVGGSLAVEALYRTTPTSGADVLRHVDQRARALTRRALTESAASGRAPRDVALSWIATRS